MSDKKKPLIGVGPVAERLHLDPKTVRMYARQGIIPAVMISPRVIRYDADRIEQWIADGGFSEVKRG